MPPKDYSYFSEQILQEYPQKSPWEPLIKQGESSVTLTK